MRLKKKFIFLLDAFKMQNYFLQNAKKRPARIVPEIVYHMPGEALIIYSIIGNTGIEDARGQQSYSTNKHIGASPLFVATFWKKLHLNFFFLYCIFI